MSLSHEQKKALAKGIPGASYAKEPFGWDAKSKALFAEVERLLAEAKREAADNADKIIDAAYALADAKAAHAVAVHEFGHDRGEFSEVEKTSKAWTKADKALRAAVAKAGV